MQYIVTVAVFDKRSRTWKT